MASLTRSALLPQCTSCTRRVARLALEAWVPLQQVRALSKAAKEAERNIVVKLLQDMPRFGRAGAYIPINPAMMRNKWFPRRIADYVPFVQLKQLKAEGVTMVRDFDFGIRRTRLQEEESDGDDIQTPARHVRPVEIELLSPERSMELLTTFIPPTIDIHRQPIDQDRVEARPRPGASDAADVLSAAAMARKPRDMHGIYGSVSTADIAGAIKSALAHNEEAARVLLSEDNITFIEGHAEEDKTRVKKLGTYRVEIKVPGAQEPITRTIRVRAKV